MIDLPYPYWTPAVRNNLEGSAVLTNKPFWHYKLTLINGTQCALHSISEYIKQCTAWSPLLGWAANEAAKAVVNLVMEDPDTIAFPQKLIEHGRSQPDRIKREAGQFSFKLKDLTLAHLSKADINYVELDDEFVIPLTQFVNWANNHIVVGPKGIHPSHLNKVMFSIRHGFAGTCMAYYQQPGGLWTIGEWKTSKRLSVQDMIQMGALYGASQEMNLKIDAADVIRLDRINPDKFEHVKLNQSDLSNLWETFKATLETTRGMEMAHFYIQRSLIGARVTA